MIHAKDSRISQPLQKFFSGSLPLEERKGSPEQYSILGILLPERASALNTPGKSSELIVNSTLLNKEA